jgi:hypothetical protein
MNADEHVIHVNSCSELTLHSIDALSPRSSTGLRSEAQDLSGDADPSYLNYPHNFCYNNLQAMIRQHVCHHLAAQDTNIISTMSSKSVYVT